MFRFQTLSESKFDVVSKIPKNFTLNKFARFAMRASL